MEGVQELDGLVRYVLGVSAQFRHHLLQERRRDDIAAGSAAGDQPVLDLVDYGEERFVVVVGFAREHAQHRVEGRALDREPPRLEGSGYAFAIRGHHPDVVELQTGRSSSTDGKLICSCSSLLYRAALFV